MNANKHLNRCNAIRSELRTSKERLTRLQQSMLYKEAAIQETMGGGSGGNERLPSLLHQEERLLNKIDSLENELLVMTRELFRIIDEIEDMDGSDVLYMRYVLSLTPVEIAERINRPIKWVYNKHYDMIREVQKDLNKDIYEIQINTREIVDKGGIEYFAEKLNVPPYQIIALVNQCISSGDKYYTRNPYSDYYHETAKRHYDRRERLRKRRENEA